MHTEAYIRFIPYLFFAVHRYIEKVLTLCLSSMVMEGYMSNYEETCAKKKTKKNRVGQSLCNEEYSTQKCLQHNNILDECWTGLKPF